MWREATARLVGSVIVIVTLAVGWATPASASIVYNYGQDWMFDSISSLYWQMLPIPTSTFVPSTGTIATIQQVEDLGAQVGTGLIGSTGNPPATAYSLRVANLLSFFQWDAPAQSDATRQANLSFSAIYQYSSPAELPPNNYEYILSSYNKADSTSATWTYIGLTTLGTYGPLRCPRELGRCEIGVRRGRSLETA